MNLFYFLYSIFPIAIYGTTIDLNIYLIILGFFSLLLSLVLFVFLRKIVRVEREKMLPLSVLQLHAKEYTQDYNNKLKEIIGEQEMKPKIQNLEYEQEE